MFVRVCLYKCDRWRHCPFDAERLHLWLVSDTALPGGAGHRINWRSGLPHFRRQYQPNVADQKTMRMSVTHTEANHLLHPLAGLPVSLPWKGYGSAIFLELGEMAQRQHARRRHRTGEATVAIEWDWRMESGAHILYGSSNSGPRIARGLESLQGVTIDRLVVEGEVPELVIVFANGQRLISAAMLASDPAWWIHLPDGRVMQCSEGVLAVGAGEAAGLTKEEEAAFEHAEQTAKRWGIPVGDAPLGQCGQCRWVAAIDAPAALLDYGVCTSAASDFDGRVVNFAGGCGVFVGRVG
jgi:hypothetical protein